MLILLVPLNLQLSVVNERRIADEFDRSIAAGPFDSKFPTGQGHFDFAVELVGVAPRGYSALAPLPQARVSDAPLSKTRKRINPLLTI